MLLGTVYQLAIFTLCKLELLIISTLMCSDIMPNSLTCFFLVQAIQGFSQVCSFSHYIIKYSTTSTLKIYSRNTESFLVSFLLLRLTKTTCRHSRSLLGSQSIVAPYKAVGKLKVVTYPFVSSTTLS